MLLSPENVGFLSHTYGASDFIKTALRYHLVDYQPCALIQNLGGRRSGGLVSVSTSASDKKEMIKLRVAKTERERGKGREKEREKRP